MGLERGGRVYLARYVNGTLGYWVYGCWMEVFFRVYVEVVGFKEKESEEFKRIDVWFGVDW